MSYGFRHRFILGPSDQLPFEGRVLRLLPGSPKEVVLEALDAAVALKEVSDLCVRGRAFSTPEEAEAAAQAARAQLERTFALLGVAADFGDRGGGSGSWSMTMVDAVYKATGVRLYYDAHELMIFLEEPDVPAVFSRVSATGSAVHQVALFERALEHPDAIRPTTERERLAFTLLSGASFAGGVDARFMMCMMALEVLIEQLPRPDTEQQHVDSLVQLTLLADGLPEPARAAFLSALDGLRRESVGAAGRRLISQLGSRLYGGHSPWKFFRLCYSVRNDLVHGNLPRPTEERVGYLASNLEVFVGHLLAGPDLVNDVLGPRPEGQP